MPKIIAVHSFRGGTGKSNTIANTAALLAARGLRVGVVDTDIQSPGIHILFGLGEDQITHSLNDYLWGKCEIKDAAVQVTPALRELSPQMRGSVFLIPSSIRAGEIARILREGYDVGLLNDGFRRLVVDLNLDVLMIDTHPGLNEETLLSIAICDTLVILLRPDSQDYQGTSVTLDVARRLEVANLLMVVNKVPPSFDSAEVQARVEQIYGCPVATVLPHSDDLMTLASSGIFVLRYPNHLVSARFAQLTVRLMR
jgi:septum site-determining protein MinD